MVAVQVVAVSRYRWQSGFALVLRLSRICGWTEFPCELPVYSNLK